MEINSRTKGQVKVMANIAYVRVSTVEQNEARQLEALKKHNIDKWFCEKVSGKDMNRPQLQAMLDYVREGDTVYIHDFSRLARSTKDLLAIVEQLQDKGLRELIFWSVKERASRAQRRTESTKAVRLSALTKRPLPQLMSGTRAVS